MEREVLAAFFLALAASMISVALPYVLMSMKGVLKPGHTLPAQRVVVDLGLLGTSFMLARTFASWISHKVKPRLSWALLSVSFAGMYLAPNYLTLLLFRVLQGLGAGLLWPHVESSVVSKGAGARGMTMLNIASNLGFSSGNLVGGFLISHLDQMSVRNPMMASVIVALVLAPLLPSRASGSGSRVPSAAMKFIYFSAFLNGLSLGMRTPVLPTYILQHVTASPKAFSLALALPGFAVLVFSYFIAARADRSGTRGKLALSSALKALQALFVASVGFISNYLALVVILILIRLTAVSSTSISKAAQGEMGANAKHFGTRQTLFGLGNSIGPIIGSALYKAFEAYGIGGGWTFVVSALISLISSYSLWMSKRSL